MMQANARGRPTQGACGDFETWVSEGSLKTAEGWGVRAGAPRNSLPSVGAALPLSALLTWLSRFHMNEEFQVKDTHPKNPALDELYDLCPVLGLREAVGHGEHEKGKELPPFGSLIVPQKHWLSERQL